MNKKDLLITNIKRNKVISYIGKFGTGKTTKIQKFLKEHHEELEYVIFNAWEFDYSNNPKFVFIYDVMMSIYEKSSKPSKAIIIYKKIIEIAKNIIINKLEKKGFSASTDNEFAKEISKYKNIHNRIEELKGKISELAATLEKPLVLVIDDLDRARPDFALEIFEISKHIFDVKNISIILIYDEEIMNNMISKKYGFSTKLINQGEGYLEKYIDSKITHDDVIFESKYLSFNKVNYFDELVGLTNNFTIRQIKKFKDEYDTNFYSNPFFYPTNPINLRIFEKALEAFLIFNKRNIFEMTENEHGIQLKFLDEIQVIINELLDKANTSNIGMPGLRIFNEKINNNISESTIEEWNGIKLNE